jgi:hypothetical protein
MDVHAMEVDEQTAVVQQYAPPHRLPHHFNIAGENHTVAPGTRGPIPEFNLLLAFLRIPEIGLEVARYMDAASIIALYHMSGPFHALVNAHMHSVVSASARHHFPWSTEVFPFFFMRALCVPDPTGRPRRDGLAPGHARWIPGLKWLAMAHFRCGVADGVWAALHDLGHRLPRGLAAPALCRAWFVMAAPANARRLALVKSARYFPDDVLRAAALLMVKLDMAMTDPVDGPGIGVLRQLMMGQRSLVPLLRLLLGDMSLLEVEMYRVRWCWRVPDELAGRGYSVLGVPAKHIGRARFEGFGQGPGLAIGVDMCVLMAAEERGLKIQETIIDMITAGFRNDTNNFPGAEPEDDDIGTILQDWKKKVWFR